jgi:hypothetical protein
LWNKPAAGTTITKLGANKKASLQTISSLATGPSYRADLATAAAHRFSKLVKADKLRRGKGKRTVTKTGRTSKKA